MTIETLKHYKLYLKKIHKYADSLGIEIFYLEEVEGEGLFSHHYKVLHIQDDLTETEMVATLLHELGHAMDFSFYNKRTMKRLFVAYENVYNGKHSKRDLELVIIAEKDAWNTGKVIAKLLKIKLGTWYSHQEALCLKDYKTS